LKEVSPIPLSRTLKKGFIQNYPLLKVLEGGARGGDFFQEVPSPQIILLKLLPHTPFKNF
jgi:hypothetical protein